MDGQAPAEEWEPRPEAVAALRERLVALRENDPDMPDLEVREVALEPGAAVVRVLFTHGRYPDTVLGVRLTADLREFRPPPGTAGRAAHEHEWLNVLPHLFVELSWTHRSRIVSEGITWLEWDGPS